MKKSLICSTHTGPFWIAFLILHTKSFQKIFTFLECLIFCLNQTLAGCDSCVPSYLPCYLPSYPPGYQRLVIRAWLSTPGYPCQVICPVIHPVVHLVIWCFLIWWSSFIKLSDGDLQSKFIQNISYLYLVLTFLCVLFHMIMNYIHTYLRFFAISAGIPVTKSKCWNAKMEQASFYHSYWVKLTCLWWKKKILIFHKRHF